MKGGSKTRRAATFALAFAALTVPAAEAGADKKKFPTRPSIKLDRETGQDTIFGKTRSKSDACERNRKVRLFHRNVDERSKSSVIATLRTNGNGKWSYRAKKNQNGERYATPGNYRVKVGTKKVSTGSGEIVCKGKNSSSMFVG